MAEHNWQINSYLNAYIRQSNQTAAGVLALVAIVAGAMVHSMPEDPQTWEKAVAGLGVLLAVGVTFSALGVVYPRLKPREQASGTIFWEHIAAHSSFADYKKGLAAATADDEVAQQNYELAFVARIKYHRLRRSVRFAALVIFYSYLVTLLIRVL